MMNETVMEQQIKAAYSEVHAPETLIRSVILRIGAAQRSGRAAQKAVSVLSEKQGENASR